MLRRRKPRRALALWLAALLLFMQQVAALHPLEHLREQLADRDKPVLQQVAEPCDECALLASAAHAVASDVDVAVPVAAVVDEHAFIVPARAPARFVLYRSRGPPARA
jgi:hypothetical protein